MQELKATTSDGVVRWLAELEEGFHIFKQNFGIEIQLKS